MIHRTMNTHIRLVFLYMRKSTEEAKSLYTLEVRILLRLCDTLYSSLGCRCNRLREQIRQDNRFENRRKLEHKHYTDDRSLHVVKQGNRCFTTSTDLCPEVDY